MICLMDGRVIISQSPGKVNLLTPDGKLEKQLTISGKARSVTQINQDTIAITYPNERAVKMFNMEKETVTKVIKLDKVCWGLSFSNNSFAVGLDNDEIRIIDLEGNTLKSIPVQSKTILDFFVHCNDRVIYSDYTDKAVYCVDESGTHIWKYKQDLSFPAGLHGLCTDSYGNIFVADYVSNRIIVISKDGKDSKVLISEKDGSKNPWCICFKRNESSGFICDGRGTYLAKFNVSCR
ncbi:TRIM56 [Mytilus edulis]|uniref:TRIM56 n=1 Tax=Mytilus edulis TaxID=6550 RepID=A0A8S3VKY9_MYTED|nr:TRIM56 [Mytilus edulis]